MTVGIHHTAPDLIIYTDAETSSRIVAAVLIEPELFRPPDEFLAVLPEALGPARESFFLRNDRNIRASNPGRR